MVSISQLSIEEHSWESPNFNQIGMSDATELMNGLGSKAQHLLVKAFDTRTNGNTDFIALKPSYRSSKPPYDIL